MAFVPDAAVMRSHEIKPLAFALYVYYCMRRNKETGTCHPSLKTASRETGINYTYCSEMRALLIKDRWIQMEGSAVRLLMGFGYSEDVSDIPKVGSSDIPKIRTQRSSDIPKMAETESSEIPKVSSVIPKPEFGNSEVPYIEPAHRTSPLNQTAAAGGRPQLVSPDPDDPLNHPAVAEYNRVMKPNPALSIHQCEVIVGTVKDREIWGNVLSLFAGNEYRGRDGAGRMVGNAVDRYRKEVARAARDGTARGKPIQQPAETEKEKQARLAAIVQSRAQKPQQRTA